jgi:hypothetical protein
MGPTNLQSNTYVPAERTQFTAPLSVKRREFLARSALSALKIVGNTDLLAESSMLTHDVLSPPSFSDEYVTCDDLTPIEKAARRLMMVLSNAKAGSHTIFTDEEVIALAFDAGCDFTVIEDSNGAAFLPIKMIRVERRSDGQIVVFEDDATKGVVLKSAFPLKG